MVIVIFIPLYLYCSQALIRVLMLKEFKRIENYGNSPGAILLNSLTVFLTQIISRRQKNADAKFQ